MSIRTKIIAIMSLIIIVITAAYTATSLFFTHQRFQDTINKDLESIVDIADMLFSTKIASLKADATVVAQLILKTPDADMRKTMQDMLVNYPDFIALAVIDRKGQVDSYGKTATWEECDEYLESAFAGNTTISTTRANEKTGDLVFHIYVPIGKEGTRVLSVTIDGLLFSEMLRQFRIWNTGNVFMLDEKGTIIANARDPSVLERMNYIQTSAQNENDESAGKFHKAMTEGGRGIGQYTLNGVPRYCAWKTLTGSAAGWSIGVIAPVNESPIASVRQSLFIAAIVLASFGIILSIVMSRNIAGHFYKIKEQNEQLKEMNESVQNASEAKSYFLAGTSHEMRTPLNAVIGLTYLTLDMKELTGEARENIEKVYSSGVTLLGIINDILDLSKIEARKLELTPQPYDLPSLINDIITLNTIHIGSKPITFVLDLDPKLPSQIQGDELRVKQIFNNLLSNAFKYTQEGEVRWRLRYERDNDNIWLVGSVSDTGIGIKPDDIARLFLDYSQIDVKNNRKTEGTGLGLPIAKLLSELMDGNITVESEYGKGSVFTVRLRQEFVTGTAIGEEVAKSLTEFRYTANRLARNHNLVRIRLPYAKVLVVDDVTTNLDIVRGILKPYDMQVECVMSGKEAIDRIKREEVRYNAIFMDHMMPEMDGIEAVKHIRELGTEYAKTIPIIALTANAIFGNEEMFLKNGFQAFLSKPIDIMVMDAAIRHWVRDKSQEPKDSGLPEKGTAKNSERETYTIFGGMQVEGLDIGNALARFGGDDKLYMDVLRSYTEKTPPLINSMRSVTADKLADYAIIVHGLKGSSRSIGAEDLAAKAKALEHAAQTGDFAFVQMNNEAMLDTADRLLATLAALFSKIDKENPKPLKPEPDVATLTLLLESCQQFDIDDAEAAMTVLEQYTYESEEGNELVSWLRSQMDVMGFKLIAKRLSTFSEKTNDIVL
ncbi:MAG: ATP-binding protein [Betaproteobacteria bacterium]|nr:ATP-binding protein [Betaproteobacteria bacterium]